MSLRIAGRTPFALLGILVVLLSACQEGSNGGRRVQVAPRASEPAGARAIALVGTMTGPRAWRGSDAFEGAQLAVHALNSKVGASARPAFGLVTADDRGRPATARRLISGYAESGRVVGIVYAGPPAGLEGAERALARVDVPLISVYADPAVTGLLSPHVFSLACPVRTQTQRLAVYVRRDRRFRSVGVVAPWGAAGDGLLSLLRSAGFGPVRLFAARYGDSGGLGKALELLRRRRVEALILPGDPRILVSAARRLRLMGASYRGTRAARISSAPARIALRRRATGWWHPQLLSFEDGVVRKTGGLPPGTVAAASLSRGAAALPVPAFRGFSRDFREWWGHPPGGWQVTGYQATRALGEAAARAGPATSAIERLSGRRFGGSPITFSPSDHEGLETSSIGLWTIPGPRDYVRGRRLVTALGWAPLGRGFAPWARGLPPPDRRALFGEGKRPAGTDIRVGIATGRSDPLR